MDFLQQDSYQNSPYGYQDIQQQDQQAQQNRYRPVTEQNPQFLQWLFDFRDKVVTPLKHEWRGEEFDDDNKVWNAGATNYPIMNEKGIKWCISYIESYINPSSLAPINTAKILLSISKATLSISNFLNSNSVCLAESELIITFTLDLIK